MPVNCDKSTLLKWVEAAQLTDITYHRTRQQLWERFAAVIKAGGDYPLDRTIFNSIKSALCRRSDSMSDDIRLAFETALQQIAEEADVVADDDDEKVEKKEKHKKEVVPVHGSLSL